MLIKKYFKSIELDFRIGNDCCAIKLEEDKDKLVLNVDRDNVKVIDVSFSKYENEPKKVFVKANTPDIINLFNYLESIRLDNLTLFEEFPTLKKVKEIFDKKQIEKEFFKLQISRQIENVS